MTALVDERQQHWDRVYESRGTQALTWYQLHAATSLRLIRQSGLDKNAAIIDVGGGSSTLVADLLNQGYTNLTVLDVSPTALAASRAQLADMASRVTWIEADITRAELPANTVDLWHDRALFHFLTGPGDRAAYVAAVTRSVKPGGYVIVAAFAESGPKNCSGLPVVRYRPETLLSALGDGFALLEHSSEDHRTPGGLVQPFIYCLFQNRTH